MTTDELMKGLYTDPGLLVAAYIRLEQEKTFPRNSMDFALEKMTHRRVEDVVVTIEGSFGNKEEQYFPTYRDARAYISFAMISRAAQKGKTITPERAVEIADFYFGNINTIGDKMSTATIN
jgi:hypothetical protein